jgi:sugar fermentation stimulation protein A
VEFPDSLIPGRFLERPNRFLTVIDCDGQQVQAHLPNTGRLREILVPGRPVYLSRARNSNRKTRYSLMLAEMDCGLVCLDSNVPTIVAAQFISDGLFAPAAGYETVRREVTLLGSRYDLLASRAGFVDLIVEVKGVTLVRGGRALFPDAPTERGTRHVEGLTRAIERGGRAAVIFMVMRSDADSFRPNAKGDPRFSRALAVASAMGVEIYALSCRVTRRGVWVDREIEVDLSG